MVTPDPRMRRRGEKMDMHTFWTAIICRGYRMASEWRSWCGLHVGGRGTWVVLAKLFSSMQGI